MSADLAPYLALVTGENRGQPDFIATLSAALQPIADNAALVATIPTLYDIDTAVGSQLDAVGVWVGRSRDLSVPLTGVYFSFDDETLGFDFGTWLGPFDPLTGLVRLPDDTYRTLLRAAIAANQWDGTIPGAYAVWAIVFPDQFLDLVFVGVDDIEFIGTEEIVFGSRTTLMIQDYGNMSMSVALIGRPFDAVTTALLTGGYLNLKPAGVRIVDYLTSSLVWAPIFGFDASSETVSGFDEGAWAVPITP